MALDKEDYRPQLNFSKAFQPPRLNSPKRNYTVPCKTVIMEQALTYLLPSTTLLKYCESRCS